MEILSGLFAGGVLQRTAGDVSDAAVCGTCAGCGPVTARVTRDGVVVQELDGAVVGTAAQGKFTAQLSGLPVGGPYVVTLSVGDETVIVPDVLVGDLWILAGQSNMQGCGNTVDAEPPHPMVRAWYMDDRWGVAQDPIHQLWAAVDRVHADISGPMSPQFDRGVGPGVAFGVALFEATGVPQGLIACAHGGTSMAQWDPAQKKLGDRSLYGASLRRVRKLGGRVAGMAWYQGCSDTGGTCIDVYTPAMQTLMKAFRKDLGAPELPVVIVQIATVHGISGWGEGWNSIQEQQRRLPETIKGLAVVPAIDLGLDDLIHISGTDQNRLGRRLAAAMLALRASGTAPAITPVKTEVVANAIKPECADIILTFDHVVGTLTAEGRPTGFSLTGGDLEDIIYRVDLEGHRAILRTSVGIVDVNERQLWYGRGLAPYCNIIDAADRAVPVFGPLPLGEPRALTPFVRTLRVSAPQPLSGTLAELPYPTGVAFTTQEFAGNLLDTHLQTAGLDTPHVQYFAARFRCPEDMKLLVQLGYDGPVAVFLDGTPCFRDPAGTNPSVPDKQAIKFDAAAGEHEVLVALDVNQGRAWGLYLRLERKDVPKRLRVKGAGGYLMPEVLG